VPQDEAALLRQKWGIESDTSLTECVERNIYGWKNRCMLAEQELEQRARDVRGGAAMTYDAKCYDLAAISLGDEPMLDNPHYHGVLARRIQDCIEDYIKEARAAPRYCPHCGKPDDRLHAYGTRGYACDARPARG